MKRKLLYISALVAGIYVVVLLAASAWEYKAWTDYSMARSQNDNATQASLSVEDLAARMRASDREWKADHPYPVLLRRTAQDVNQVSIWVPATIGHARYLSGRTQDLYDNTDAHIDFVAQVSSDLCQSMVQCYAHD
ncbi:hypothetical protein [Bifidobacterium magnum]|mgnify:CR=1 FL=1|uniref:Uncharacterized protein n=1 Tax=Bifidobacterium magnum TaxID=1692 RepID=A0A087BAL7_9BIFI|nr:hypothetical protein [Bifidobacterium magnum]KFI68067.1 hypothetical protein BMAGN_0014 [Bifidobacterium magnum]